MRKLIIKLLIKIFTHSKIVYIFIRFYSYLIILQYDCNKFYDLVHTILFYNIKFMLSFFKIIKWAYTHTQNALNKYYY